MGLCLINFAGRISSGNCDKICKFIKSHSNVGNNIVINFSQLDIHNCNKCNYECFTKVGCIYNDDIKFIYDKILDYDNIIFIIPIYSDFPCSNYFIFRERSQCYFNDEKYNKFISKQIKFIIIGNTGLENTMKVIKDDFCKATVKDVLFLSSHDYNTKSINGNLIDFIEVKDKILEFINSFILHNE